MTYKEHLLLILGEECAEVVHRASKSLRFGRNEKQAFQPYDNEERLSAEVSDVEALIEMCRLNGILRPRDGTAIVNKKNKVEEYLKYSKEVGTL